MQVKCPFCAEQVTFRSNGVCPACQTQLSEQQQQKLSAFIQKKQAAKSGGKEIQCALCGTRNSAERFECSDCGEPLRETTEKGDTALQIYRKKKTLVFPREAVLPDVCIKTNHPAKGNREEKKLYWYPVWAFLVGGLLLAFCFQKKAVVSFGVSKEYQKHKRKLKWTGIAIAMGGVMLSVLMIFIVNSDLLKVLPAGSGEEICIVLAVVGIVVSLAGLIFAILQSRFVTPVKITKTHVFLNGAHAGYLDRFPQWEV